MHHTFKKYHDLPAAIAIGIFLIGALFYAVQLVFMAESWLAAHAIGTEAVPAARACGAAYFGFSVGLILTFVNGPDGQRTFFIALSVAQVLSFVILWQARITGDLRTSCWKILLPSLYSRSYCYLGVSGFNLDSNM